MTDPGGPGSGSGTRLGTRIAIAMLLAAVVPLALASWNAHRLSQAALEARTRELHRRAAEGLSLVVTQDLDRRVRAVQDAAAAVRYDTLDTASRLGALRLAFRQIEGAAIVVLIDRAGQQTTEPVFLTEQTQDPALASRPVVRTADLEAFARNIPLSAAQELGTSLGLPHAGADGAPRIAVAARTRDAQVLAVEMDLGPLVQAVTRARVGEAGLAFVVDEEGRVVLDPELSAIASAEDRSQWPLVAAALAKKPIPARVQHPRLGASLGAFAPVPLFGWTAIVLEPEAQALVAARDLATDQLLWIAAAVMVALLLGLYLSRAIGRPIAALHQGAKTLGAGDLSHRVAGADRSDELGDLARSFNTMAEEIQRWNLELERRVEEKATELTQVQELLSRTERLAAVGELGAGVAHEIKNPLTSLLGMVHMILAKEEGDPALRRRVRIIQEQARRINEIVENLRRLTEETAGAGFLPTLLEKCLDRVVDVTHERCLALGVTLVRETSAEDVKISTRGDELMEAFRRIVDNALDAMPEGGILTISVDLFEPRLATIRFRDTGGGIPDKNRHRIFEPFFTTRRDRQAKGLGLTLVHQTIERHNGRVTVESQEGTGAVLAVILPTPMERSLA